MAPSPFRRRKPRQDVSQPGAARRTPSAAAAAALLKRDKVAGLLPSRSGEPAPVTPAPPQPSNYDAPGPVANTATPIPAPDPHGEPPETIDEADEEAAAAAEAAAIGGTLVGLRRPGAGRARRRGAPPARRGRRGRVRGPGAGRGGAGRQRDLPRRRHERRRAPDRRRDRAGRAAAARARRPAAGSPAARSPGWTQKDESASDKSRRATTGSDDWRTWSGRSVNP